MTGRRPVPTVGDMPDPATEPQPPVFPEAAAASLETAIDALAAELERVASSHRTTSGALPSWSGRGQAVFLRHLGDGIDGVADVARQLRADADAVAGHRALAQVAQDNYETAHSRWAEED